jgi:hypothetical protein
MKLILLVNLIKLVLSEGYYCPYDFLGATETNDLLYDYYSSNDNGNSWERLNETGWMTRIDYCNAKGDTLLHFDAGQAKCEDSQGTCLWVNNQCTVNPYKLPDCLDLCQKVINNEGLPCLGNCLSGRISREILYSICDKESTTTSRPSKTKTTRTRPVRIQKLPRPTIITTTTTTPC